jgi:hypothetical protein
MDYPRQRWQVLALMLGVRRPGVTVALDGLARANLIRVNYGRLTILDRAHLKNAARGSYSEDDAVTKLLAIRIF